MHNEPQWKFEIHHFTAQGWFTERKSQNWQNCDGKFEVDRTLFFWIILSAYGQVYHVSLQINIFVCANTDILWKQNTVTKKEQLTLIHKCVNKDERGRESLLTQADNVLSASLATAS